MNNNRHLVHAALIAAVYAVLTIAFAPLSYGQIQVRFAEALTILPFFTPAAIPGLFIGCIVANIFGPGGVPDVIFGSAASLISAYLSYKMPANGCAAAAGSCKRNNNRIFAEISVSASFVCDYGWWHWGS